jgi:cell wall-associated NlpC family hydrolase
MTGQRLATAALELVGTRFRLHGRDPAIGLDCIGLLEAALHRIGHPCRLPNGYALRHRHVPALAGAAKSAGLLPAGPMVLPGDVTVFRIAPSQCHLAIATRAGRIVHAHAGLRRVVESAVPETWVPLAQFRLAANN